MKLLKTVQQEKLFPGLECSVNNGMQISDKRIQCSFQMSESRVEFV